MNKAQANTFCSLKRAQDEVLEIVRIHSSLPSNKKRACAAK